MNSYIHMVMHMLGNKHCRNKYDAQPVKTDISRTKCDLTTGAFAEGLQTLLSLR